MPMACSKSSYFHQYARTCMPGFQRSHLRLNRAIPKMFQSCMPAVKRHEYVPRGF